jgi:DHA2 family lincomycin resistance protein-like MFS transporter
LKHEKLDRKSAVIIGTLLVTAFIGMLNETALGVALPQVMKELQIPESTGQWLNTAFMLTVAIVIPTTGYLQVRFSRRRLFLFGMGAFTIGTLVCAIAPTFEFLVVGRVIQAGGAGLMFPLLMTTIMVLVPEGSRGRIMGNIGIVMSVAPAIGPSFGGLVLNFSNWRSIFWIILPIAVVVTLFGYNKVRGEQERSKAGIDWLSVVISVFAFGGLIYGLSSFGDQARGKALLSPYIPLAVGLVAMIWFVRRQLKLAKEDRALLDVNVFRSRTFALSTFVLLAMCVSLFGLALLVPIFAQTALGFTALQIGLALLPGTLFNGLISPYVGRLSDKYGPTKLMRPGSIVAALSLIYMCTFDINTQLWQLFVSNFILSAGLAFIFTPLFTVSVSSLEPKLYPHGTAITGAAQQIAGAAGTAMMITVFTLVSVAAKNGGEVSDIRAATDGAHWAFVSGAVISIAAIFVTWAIKPVKK